MYIFAFSSFAQIFQDLAYAERFYDQGDKDEMPAKIMYLGVLFSLISFLFWLKYLTSKDGVATRKVALTATQITVVNVIMKWMAIASHFKQDQDRLNVQFKAGKIPKEDYVYVPTEVLILPFVVSMIFCAYYYSVVAKFLEAAKDPASHQIQAEVNHELNEACCCCIPLRTTMYLLAAISFFSTVDDLKSSRKLLADADDPLHIFGYAMIGSAIINIIQTFYWYQYLKQDDDGESRLYTVKAVYWSIYDLLYKLLLITLAWSHFQSKIEKSAKVHISAAVVICSFLLALSFQIYILNKAKRFVEVWHLDRQVSIR